MAGSVFFVTIVLAVLLLALGAAPFTLIPVVIIGFGAIFAIPLLRKARETAVAQSDAAPSGTTTTRDASYDPTAS